MLQKLVKRHGAKESHVDWMPEGRPVADEPRVSMCEGIPRQVRQCSG